MEISEEKKQFFINHKEEIGKLIEKFNGRRIHAGADPLTEDEIDQGVEEMMELAQSGGNLMTYRFPIPEPNRVVKTESPKIQGSKVSFEIVKCSNGFIMTQAGKDAFIFKTAQELLGILKGVLFDDSKVEAQA